MLLEEVVPGVTPGSSVPYYYHTDWVGSVRALTNGSGAVSNTYTYDAYGKPLSSTGSAPNPFGYTGEYTDSESGFVYLRARYYDPESQQFLTADPALAWTEQAYAYVAGSPTNLTDPTGLASSTGMGPFGWSLATASAIGAVANVLIADWTSGYNPTSQQLLAAAFTGAFMGVGGMLATMIGNQLARGLLASVGFATGGPAGFILGALLAGAIDWTAGWLAQTLYNALDPCHASDPVAAANWSALGGLVPFPGQMGSLGEALTYAWPHASLETIPEGLRVKAWLTAATFVSTLFSAGPALPQLLGERHLDRVIITDQGPIYN